MLPATWGNISSMSVFALRGAITVDTDTPEEIRERTIQLLEQMFERNNVSRSDVISVFFTSTIDLLSLPPAAAARAFGLTDVALLCAQEAQVQGGLEKCVRVMLHLNTTKDVSEFRHVFLRRATEARPDLAEPGDENF